MAAEPSYPDDAPVGNDKNPPDSEPFEGAEKAPAPNRTRHIVTGAAIGIGSAALVAALLYARRSSKPGEAEKE